MRRVVALNLALASILVAACVTINVYFPAAAAEKAADEFVKDVLGKKQDEAAPKSNDQTSLHVPQEQRHLLASAAYAVLNFVIPAAHAQADIDVNTPEARAIKASMTARHSQLAKYFASGAIGYTADGMVELRDQNAVPLPERTTVRKLLADDNRDRAALYTEIAKANGHPEWESDIRAAFAKRWIANAETGWYYQEGGAWKQK